MPTLPDPGVRTDGEIQLVLAQSEPENPEKGYVPCYHFQIVRCSDGAVAGGCTLRVGQNEALTYSGHIGYAVEGSFRGRHFAAKACRLLFPLARQLGMEKITITCAPENTASRRSCETAGCRFLGIFPVPEWHEMHASGRTEICRYEMDLTGGTAGIFGLTLRPGAAADYPAITAACLNEGWASFSSPVFTPALKSSLLKCAYIGQEFAGFARAITDGYLTIFLCEVLVVPLYRGLGVGRALVDAIGQDYPTARMDLISESDGFYEKLGMRKIGTGYRRAARGIMRNEENR